jgi:hypothetical protein
MSSCPMIDLRLRPVRQMQGNRRCGGCVLELEMTSMHVDSRERASDKRTKLGWPRGLGSCGVAACGTARRCWLLGSAFGGLASPLRCDSPVASSGHVVAGRANRRAALRTGCVFPAGNFTPGCEERFEVMRGQSCGHQGRAGRNDGRTAGSSAAYPGHRDRAAIRWPAGVPAQGVCRYRGGLARLTSGPLAWMGLTPGRSRKKFL